MGSNAKKYMSVLEVIALSIVLLTGISLVPALQIGVNGQVQQLQQPQQQKQVGLSQVIKQIAQQVSNANPGTNATHVYQILVQLAKQTAQTASKEQAIQEIQQISSQIAKYPFGPLSQVLSHFAQQVASGNSNVVQIVQQTIQEKVSSGGSKNITQTLSNTAVQEASGGSKNVNQVIRQTAQIISKQTGVSIEKIESIIIQIALQIAQAQGKDITGQSILQVANQIAKNPNGIFTQLLLQLVKQDQDDNGKSDHTVKIIKTVVRGGGGSSSSSSSSSSRSSNSSSNPPTTPPTTTPTAASGGIKLGPNSWCILCAVGNTIDNTRVNNVAIGTAKLTGVSVEATQLALSDAILRTANKAGPAQASQALAAFEADAAAANPTTLNKIGDFAQVYESGNDVTATQVSDSLADKLSTRADTRTALVETPIPDSASVAAGGGTTGELGVGSPSLDSLAADTTPTPPPPSTTPPPPPSPPTITDSLSLDAVEKGAGYISQVTGSDDVQVKRTFKGILVTAFNKGLKEPEPLRNQIENLVDQAVTPNSDVQKVVEDIAEKKESKESSKIEIANEVIEGATEDIAEGIPSEEALSENAKMAGIPISSEGTEVSPEPPLSPPGPPLPPPIIGGPPLPPPGPPMDTDTYTFLDTDTDTFLDTDTDTFVGDADTELDTDTDDGDADTDTDDGDADTDTDDGDADTDTDDG